MPTIVEVVRGEKFDIAVERKPLVLVGQPVLGF
jgi:hypothetical protein